MKSITFVYPQMVMGGAEKVLIRLINHIDREKYKINVILFKHGGELEHAFPDDVDVEYADTIPLSYLVKHGKLLSLIKGLYCRIRIRMAKTYEEKSYWSVKVCKIPDTISQDCVICFSHYNFMSICLAAQSNAKKKILWVHSTFRENRNQRLYEQMLEQFDAVFCVSNASKDNFDQCFPQYAKKSQVVYNLIDQEQIIHDSLEEIDEEICHPAIVTVGRLDEQKGLDLVPDILRKLLDNGYDVHWYLVGEGDYRKILSKKIGDLQLQNRLILLGNKTNPFPYMRQCDIYVQPSRYEGFCTTTNEARILCKPVVASNILPMQEQFVNGKTGVLCELNVDSFLRGIKLLLDNSHIKDKLTGNLKSLQFDNNVEIEKILNFIEKRKING